MPGRAPLGGPSGSPGPMGPGPMGGPSGPRPGSAPAPLPSGPMAAPPMAGGPMGRPPGVGAPGPAPGPAPAVRKCGQCSTDVPPNFKFCGVCGAAVENAPASAPSATSTTPQTSASPGTVMTLIRPDGSEGGSHNLHEGVNKIGRNHGAIFESDGYLSPEHAELIISSSGTIVRDLGSLNGVFVRMTVEEEIKPGQIIRIGQELLRFDLIEPPAPLSDGTEIMGSPNPGYWGKITSIIGKGVDGSAFPLLGDSVTLGRERGDINFPDDGYVSGLHARLSARDGRVYLSDLGSSNGTFIKVHNERKLEKEGFVLLGQQLFRVRA